MITLCLGTGWPTVLSCLDHVDITQSLLTFTKTFFCCWETSLMLWPSIFTGRRLLCSGHVHGLVGCTAKVEGRWIEVTAITSVQWKRRHGDKGQGDYEGTDGGFSEDTDSGCFESTGGSCNVGICRKARLKRCLSHSFKWAVSSGFSVSKHAYS